MKKKFLVNYLGSISFVLIILLFLVSIVLISRFALSEGGSFGDYVASTKDLLENIDEVEKEVVNIEKNVTRVPLSNINVFNGANYGVNGTSFLNLENGNSFFTLKFDYQIIDTQKYYLLNTTNGFQFKKGQKIIFENGEGIFLNDYGNAVEIYDLENSKITNIDRKKVLGVVIYEKN